MSESVDYPCSTLEASLRWYDSSYMGLIALHVTACLFQTLWKVDGEFLDDGDYRTLKFPDQIKLLLAEIQDVKDLGLPPPLAPAIPQPDDAERVHDTPVPFEGQNLVQALLTSNTHTQMHVRHVRERFRKTMLRSPPFLKGVDAPGPIEDKAPLRNSNRWLERLFLRYFEPRFLYVFDFYIIISTVRYYTHIILLFPPSPRWIHVPDHDVGYPVLSSIKLTTYISKIMQLSRRCSLVIYRPNDLKDWISESLLDRTRNSEMDAMYKAIKDDKQLGAFSFKPDIWLWSITVAL